MSGSRNQFLILMLLLTILTLAGGILSTILSDIEGSIPLTGLDYPIHSLTVNYLWPVLGSVLCALLFPRIFCPTFLGIKKIVMSHFKNGQINVDTKPNSIHKWFSRTIYVSLLVFGLQAFFFSFFPYEILLTPSELAGYQGLGIDIRFTLGVTGGIVALLTPIAVGILSIGWALEDSGLVHYDLPKESDKMYEIEPIFRRYISYLKGYAGVSSLLFLVTIIIYLINFSSDRLIDAAVTILMPFFAMAFSALGYLVYTKANTTFLRGKYQEIGHITEEEIRS